MSDGAKPDEAAVEMPRRLADYATVFDLLGRLPGTRDEGTVVADIRCLFAMLCAPRFTAYVPFRDGRPQWPAEGGADPALARFAAGAAPHAWTDSDTGFVLRIEWGGETFGLLEVEGVAFPQYRIHYLNLALTISRVCGLAIHNARTYDRLQGALAQVEAALREQQEAERKIEGLNAELKARILEVEAANKELENFSYSVSHDLRAPLRGIDGWSRFLEEDYAAQLDARGREYLQTIRTETARMGQLIEAMLQLARITRCALRREPVDLSALARAVERELREAEPQRKVAVEIAPELADQGDAVLLRAVLRNLMGNAWKFTRDAPEARIEFGADASGAVPVYRVRDNGAGFNMEFAAKLFTPFQRLHRQEDFPGTGVGLATVQRIIHRHGGAVWAEAAVGHGATFYFTLQPGPGGAPAAPAEAP